MKKSVMNKPIAVALVSSVSLLSLVAAAPVLQPAGQSAGAASSVATPNITLDPVHSMAVFRIQHLGAGFFWGRFNELAGTVAWPLDGSAAPVFDVTAQVNKVDTGSEKLDGNLQGPNFFNQVEFPTITFKSKGATKSGDNRWTVTGDLTLRGVTKSIEADCTMVGIGKGPTGQKVGFECLFEINRADFGMKWGIDAPKGALGNSVKMVIALEGDVAKPKE
jgi:polyisoprenoid-binding protein YceI